MKVREFFIKMFTVKSGLSSKRICGFIGWVVCLFICIWCTIYMISAPEIVDILFICSTALLGADTIIDIWKNNKLKQNKNEEAIH